LNIGDVFYLLSYGDLDFQLPIIETMVFVGTSVDAQLKYRFVKVDELLASAKVIKIFEYDEEALDDLLTANKLATKLVKFPGNVKNLIDLDWNEV
jgi:hypothetical protein